MAIQAPRTRCLTDFTSTFSRIIKAFHDIIPRFHEKLNDAKGNLRLCQLCCVPFHVFPMKLRLDPIVPTIKIRAVTSNQISGGQEVNKIID